MPAKAVCWRRGGRCTGGLGWVSFFLGWMRAGVGGELVGWLVWTAAVQTVTECKSGMHRRAEIEEV